MVPVKGRCKDDLSCERQRGLPVQKERGNLQKKVNRVYDPHTKDKGNFTVGTKTSLCPSGTMTGMEFSKYGYKLELAKPTSSVSKQTIREYVIRPISHSVLNMKSFDKGNLSRAKGSDKTCKRQGGLTKGKRI